MHKPVKHLVVAAASIVVAVGSPAAQTIDMVVDSAIYAIELNASAAAENFAKRLPMKVVWEDFGKLERIARLSERLDVGRDPVVKSPVRGRLLRSVGKSLPLSHRRKCAKPRFGGVGGRG